jgi:hypothetical protein
MAEGQNWDVFLEILPIVATVLLATAGWIFTYFHHRRMASRTARLDRVNQQLRLLYGPLYARLLATDAAWESFWDTNQPAHGQNTYFCTGFETTEDEKKRWRLWMREVFHPSNAKLESLIVDHMDLMEGDDMEDVFIEALAHISVYHAVLKQWEEGDFSEHSSVINFPDAALLETVEPAYKRLRKEQEELISFTQKRRRQ